MDAVAEEARDRAKGALDATAHEGLEALQGRTLSAQTVRAVTNLEVKVALLAQGIFQPVAGESGVGIKLGARRQV